MIVAIELGLIYAIMALGVYLTFRILNFPDLTVDGSFTMGAAIAAKLIVDGYPIWLATALAVVGGGVAGWVTGLLHTKGRINGLLAGILTHIPVLFTAITDPVIAGLVDSNEAPGGNATGTSDLPPNAVEDQIGLIPDVVPGAKTVGILYASGEDNSVVQVEMARDAADALGLEVREVTVTNSNEVGQAAESLADVDVIYVPTDNVVVSALPSVIQVAESRSIPLIVGEGDSVREGGIATIGINYFDLGYKTGQMALRILEDGDDPATMPVERLEDVGLIVNPAAAERMGVTLSEEFLARADQIIE